MLLERRKVHRGGEDVVRALAHVHVVVRCTSSPASVAITSFAFVFDDVPEPVWKTSIGNWSSSSPAAMRSPAAAMRSRLVGVEQSELAVHARGRSLDAGRASARPAAGIGSPETGKLAIALRVSPPHSSFGVACGVGHDDEASADARPEGAPPSASASRAAGRAARRQRARRRRSPASRRTRRMLRPSHPAAPPGVSVESDATSFRRAHPRGDARPSRSRPSCSCR